MTPTTFSLDDRDREARIEIRVDPTLKEGEWYLTNEDMSHLKEVSRDCR